MNPADSPVVVSPVLPVVVSPVPPVVDMSHSLFPLKTYCRLTQLFIENPGTEGKKHTCSQ